MLAQGFIRKPDKIVEKLKEYTDMGLHQFLLAFPDPFDSCLRILHKSSTCKIGKEICNICAITNVDVVFIYSIIILYLDNPKEKMDMFL
jgi:hypothetical protein